METMVKQDATVGFETVIAILSKLIRSTDEKINQYKELLTNLTNVFLVEESKIKGRITAYENDILKLNSSLNNLTLTGDKLSARQRELNRNSTSLNKLLSDAKNKACNH